MYKINKASTIYCMAQEYNQYFYNNYKRSITFKNWESLCCTPETYLIRSDQSLSCVWLFVTPGIAARQASLSITNSQSSLRLTSIESVMPSSHLILCRPFSSCPQSLPASESFPTSQLFAWDGQSTGVSALASFLPKKSLKAVLYYQCIKFLLHDILRENK